MSPTSKAFSQEFEKATYRKVTWRLIPFLFLLYIVAFLDRVNVGYAKLQMSSDLQLSEATYGLGAGLFFIGYFLFEVPSNLILERVGARIWIARILIVWGVISTAFMFVHTPTHFYVLRFLLGVGEAGFFPGVILFLTYWFPVAFRARMVAMFMTAIAVAGVIGGPLSGWVMRDMAGLWGLAGWQWVFLLEGVPAIILGFVTLGYLQDGPHKAKWLSQDQRQLVLIRLDEDRLRALETSGHRHLLKSLQDYNLWVLVLIVFCINLGLYGVNFFLPQLLKDMGVKDLLWNGIVSAIPFGIAAIAMVLNGRHSDKTMERRWHTALPAVVAGIGLVIAATAGTGHTALAIFGLTLATTGMLCSVSAFWTIPPTFFAASAAAGGIALINSLANLGGFFGPYLMGLVREYLHSNTVGLYFLASALFLCAALTLMVLKSRSTDVGKPLFAVAYEGAVIPPGR